jgi:hypothetical protein
MDRLNQYNVKVKKNPLKTREDLERALYDLYEPLFKIGNEQKAGLLNLGTNGSVYGQKTRELEAFLRPFWGWGPLFSVTPNKYPAIKQQLVKGMIEGTTPTSDSYWGIAGEYDQRFVEMAALSCTLIHCKVDFWDSLSTVQKENLANWLYQINEHTIPNNNWLFFRVLVNIALKKCGRIYSLEKLEADLQQLDQYYLENGWYFDGYKNQIDYYIPFAMHYYGLIYAKVMEDEDQERAAIYKERAIQFAQDFKEWFSSDGSAIPFGRSLTYRFAQSSFWAALAFADVEALPWGQIKKLVLNNLRYWFKQSIFSPEGLLTIGYGYQNLNMAEGYNAPGSPYWALKTFLLLALPENHPFWQAEEEPVKFLEKSVQKSPRMIIRHDSEGKEVQAFTSGQHSHEHAHADAKYEKLVYSTTFGFSVPKGNVLLKQGAFDNCLALSECDNRYRSRSGCESYEIHDDYIVSTWKPWKDVIIDTYLIPLTPWHVRIHRIHTNRELETAEGGFSAPVTEGAAYVTKDEHSLFYPSEVGTTGIIDIDGKRKADLIIPEPNTNLLYSKTVLPTLTSRLAPGKHLLVSSILGTDRGVEEISFQPIVSLAQECVMIQYRNRKYEIKIK